MQNELYYATGNAGKFEEVQGLFKTHSPDINLQQYQGDIAEIQSLDQREIALDKARKAWQALKKPLLIDDSGLFFADYKQFPGTLSKFIFQAIGFEGIFKLVNEGASAAFILQLVYIDEQHTKVFEGRCEGTLVKPVAVETHPQLPLTAIFKPNGSDKTYAELRYTAEFAQFAFRQHALKNFLTWFKNK